MKLQQLRPALEQIDQLITQAKAVPEHHIVNEEKRESYLHGLLDAKNAILDLVDGGGEEQ